MLTACFQRNILSRDDRGSREFAVNFGEDLRGEIREFQKVIGAAGSGNIRRKRVQDLSILRGKEEVTRNSEEATLT